MDSYPLEISGIVHFLDWHYYFPFSRGHPGGLSTALCCHLIEALFILANIVWLILGAIWVYGSKRYVVFQRGWLSYSFDKNIIFFNHDHAYKLISNPIWTPTVNSAFLIPGIFDDHFCDEGLYWFAFAAVTLQILLIILGIVGVLILVCLGAFKVRTY